MRKMVLGILLLSIVTAVSCSSKAKLEVKNAGIDTMNVCVEGRFHKEVPIGESKKWEFEYEELEDFTENFIWSYDVYFFETIKWGTTVGVSARYLNERKRYYEEVDIESYATAALVIEDSDMQSY